jgi:hypothetical protein
MTEGNDLIKRLARGFAAVKATTGSQLIAESNPIALASRMGKPVIERRRRRADGSERYILLMPFGEGEVRIELKPDEYQTLATEMVRFWNRQIDPQLEANPAASHDAPKQLPPILTPTDKDKSN